MSDYLDLSIKILKKNNFRITKPRKTVIELLNSSTRPLSAYEIKDVLDSEGRNVDIVSIYRIIECLEENKLIHKVLSSGKVMKCQIEHEDKCTSHVSHHCHHLLICEKCSSVEEVHCSGINTVINKIQKELKFEISKHNLEFYGTCNKCKKSKV